MRAGVAWVRELISEETFGLLPTITSELPEGPLACFFKQLLQSKILPLVTNLGCYFFPEDSVSFSSLIKMLRREEQTSIPLAIITYLLLNSHVYLIVMNTPISFGFDTQLALIN